MRCSGLDRCVQQLTSNYTWHGGKYTSIWLRAIKWSLPSVGWQGKAVQGPGDLRCWIPSGGALQGYSRPRLQRLLDERIEQHRWRVCETQKTRPRYIHFPVPLIFIPCSGTLCAPAFLYDFKETFEARVWLWNGQGNIDRNTGHEARGILFSFFFFFKFVATRHRHRTFDHDGVSFLSLSRFRHVQVDSKNGRRAEAEEKNKKGNRVRAQRETDVRLATMTATQSNSSRKYDTRQRLGRVGPGR